jgi:hypothetical protein
MPSASFASRLVIAAALIGTGATRAHAAPERALVAANPLGWLVGIYGATASVAVTDHVALRGEFDYARAPFFLEMNIIEGDVGAPIYVRRTFHGVFVEPGVVVRRIEEWWEGDSTYIGGKFVEIKPGSRRYIQWGPQLLVGWQWTGASGVSIAAAAGVTYNVNNDPRTSGREVVVPNGYLRFGYAF